MELSLSLLSSFIQTGLKNIPPGKWPLVTPNVELYAYMDSDLNFVFKTGTHWTNTCEALASNPDPSVIAHLLHDYFSKHQCKVVGISTFLPEIMVSSRPSGNHWEKAAAGLMHLVAVARGLRLLGHPAKTLELVGGSAVGGIWCGKRKHHPGTSRPIFVLHRRNPSDAIRDLIERLEPVAVTAAEDEPVYLALELEPGPLFTLGEAQLVLQLCQKLESDVVSTAMQKVVGINLDIAHWALIEKVSPEWLRTHRTLSSRVVHAHISGHSKGHFGDIQPTTEMFKEFSPWISLLKEIAANKFSSPEGPQFSGFVSCELECCRNAAIVTETMKKLLTLF